MDATKNRAALNRIAIITDRLFAESRTHTCVTTGAARCGACAYENYSENAK